MLRHSPGAWALVLLLPALTLLNRYLVQYVLYKTADSGTVSDLGSPLQILYTLFAPWVLIAYLAGLVALSAALTRRRDIT